MTNKKYYIEHVLPKAREQQKKYYQANREKILAKMKELRDRQKAGYDDLEKEKKDLYLQPKNQKEADEISKYNNLVRRKTNSADILTRDELNIIMGW